MACANERIFKLILYDVKNEFIITIVSYIILKIRESAHLTWLNLKLNIKPAQSKFQINIKLLSSFILNLKN